MVGFIGLTPQFPMEGGPISTYGLTYHPILRRNYFLLLDSRPHQENRCSCFLHVTPKQFKGMHALLFSLMLAQTNANDSADTFIGWRSTELTARSYSASLANVISKTGMRELDGSEMKWESVSGKLQRRKEELSQSCFGFENAGHTPALVRAVTKYIRSVTPGGAYIMAGAPAHWRTATSDADRNPGFLDVWLNDFDAISPWTVGRYRDEKEADDFAETRMKGDVALIKQRNEEGRWRNIDYIPVVLPGGSGFNVSRGKWGFNDIKRNGGRFLWQQIFNAKRLGVRTMYGAMWDEYDEGTAFMPAIEKKRMLPVSDSHPFLALDADGYDLPSDWYMRICGFAAEGLRSERRIFETFPSKEVEDYWASRPKYEDVDPKSGDFVSGASCKPKDVGISGGGEGMSYQEWLSAQKEDKEEQPPPPYSLEAEESSSEPSFVAHNSAASTNTPTIPTIASVAGEVASLTATFETSTQSNPGSPHQAIVPPPVNASSRPQHRRSISPHTFLGRHDQTSPTPDRMNTYQTHAHNNALSATGNEYDPVASLTNDFGRHGLGPVDSRQTVSPPPVPASRPATDHYNWQGRPHSRPQSQAGHAQPSSPEPLTQPQTGQGQWPPSEWGIKNNLRPQSPPLANQTSYPSNLSMPPRPIPPRPHSAMNAGSSYLTSSGGIPTPDVHGGHLYGPLQTPYVTSGVPPVHRTDTATLGGSPYPSTDSAPLFPQGPGGGSSYLSYNPSTWSSQTESFPLSPSKYRPPVPHSTGFGRPSDMSPPHSPVIGTSYYPGQTTGHSFPVVQGSSYPEFTSYGEDSRPSYGAPHGMPYPPSDSLAQGGGFHIPHKPSGDSYFGSSQPQSSGYAPSYISGPTPFGVSSTMPSSPSWYPGSSSTSAAPPVHPGRPSTQSPYSNSSPWSSTASPGLLGSALSAVDRVAGKKTREQLESVAQSAFSSLVPFLITNIRVLTAGTKLLQKFTK
ncbi:hypothetical protein C0992_006601 [Termitomyces sp. T32_za158]|nr:hypothetical protein C0992_006601 [Termitomyces sp. T32_za158]